MPRQVPAASAFAQRRFMFATGIEGSYPTISDGNGGRKRMDEFIKCDHYNRWDEDFHLVKELGISFLRYGPPYFSAHVRPGQYDWDFADATFNKLRQLQISPIADLCHFGLPDWLENFQNPEFPRFFAEYASAFAKRYHWIRLFTPVNEIMVAAQNSALYGAWNERLRSERAFVTAVKLLSMANELAKAEILKVQPEATFIQSESTEYFHAEEPACEQRAAFLNELRFLASDLSYGFPVNAQIYDYLLDNGMTRKEYHWFVKNHFTDHCVMGNDYYVRNEHLVHADDSISPSGEIFGYYVITRQYYERYRLPVMHTETNLMDSDAAPHWLKKQWSNMHRLKIEGVPILGFTWYSLTDQVDWDSALAEDNGNVNPLGLYDLNRRIRPVGLAYKKLIAQWSEVLPTESFSLTANH